MDYYKEYRTYKKKYLALKKRISLEQAGGNQQGLNRRPMNYLKYGPVDGTLVSSDEEEKRTYNIKLHTKEKNISESSEIEATEDILNHR